jgi:hypothetical protein
MGANDGSVLGLTRILGSAPDANHYNIVLVAEGFTQAQQPTFNSRCADFVTALQAEPWYAATCNAINVHRLNVTSTDSGCDDPSNCPDGSTGSGTTVNTYFDAHFCGSGVRRCLTGDASLVRSTVDGVMPQWEVALVIVNTTAYGGCAGRNVAWTSIRSGWTNVALHELGHAGFGLADEYQYWEGCGSGETDRDNAPTWEPGEPNVTTVTTRANLKWRNLVRAETPIPTMLNPDCTKCDQRPNVLTNDDIVGLYEGAQYYHCGRFRPAYRCRMRNNQEAFCRVCVEAILERLGNHVTPTPRLDVVPQSLDFGQVAHGLTIYRAFEVRNVRLCMPGPMRVQLGAPTGVFSYAPGTETSFTLPSPVLEAYTSRTVFVAFTSPVSGGPNFTGVLTVSTPDDATNPSDTVTLTAEAVTPPPVDSVLVIDRSGSMQGATGIPNEDKADHAIKAAQLYVSLLKQNDRIGVVRYNDQARDPQDILLTLRVAGDLTSGAGRLAAASVLTKTNLNPTGYTSIGGGILLGSKILDAAVANSRALVVLTDGIQNRSPDIPTATAVVSAKTPRQRVFAVGLGLHQLQDKLKQIATVTNGMTQITGDLVAHKEFLLQKLYVQILSDASDEAFVKDPPRLALAGHKQSNLVYLGEVDVSADFIVAFRPTNVFPKYLSVWLEAPDGSMITMADAASLPNVSFVEQSNHVFYRVQFPAWPDKPQAHMGAWKVWVENLALGEYFLAGNLHYSVMVKARSDLRLAGRIVQTDYRPGSTMTVILEPSLYGQPVVVDPPVEVSIERPDGVRRTIQLQQQAQGGYVGEFHDTYLVGPYLASSTVWVTTPRGERVTRYRHMTGLIFDPVGDGGEWEDGHGSEDPCVKAQAALRVLAELIERCCKQGHVLEGEQLSNEDLIEAITRRLDG